MPDPLPRHGLTTVEVARLLRVSPDKVRTWIRQGSLRAVNTATKRGRVRYVVLPDALREFAQRHAAATDTPTPPPRRRRRPTDWVDFYPDN